MIAYNSPSLHQSHIRLITRTLIPQRRIQQSRSISNVNHKLTKAQDEDDDLLSSLTKRRGGRTNKSGNKVSPREWLNSEEGIRFRDPVIGGTNWLGDDVPFPTNPWFKPKPPLWDGLRTKVYESFKSRVNSIPTDPNPTTSDSVRLQKQHEQILIRQTSEQWGISKERVSAIIRLKALEESWSIPIDRSPQEKQLNRTLQLNFEKGMENVLGVKKSLSKEVDEDVNVLMNRKLERKSKFYGFEFVPLDSPISMTKDETIDPPQSDEPKPQKYQEDDIPSNKRHIVGPDGIPRPPRCYISNPPNKIPMVFTDVSDFPRQPKPMSKQKAKHYPRTSLLHPFNQHPNQSQRRSNCTLASMSVRLVDSGSTSPNHLMTKKTNPSISDKEKEIVSELLRKFKGCSNTDAGLKMLEEFSLSPRTTTDPTIEAQEPGKLDHEMIKEMVLIKAGGMSFNHSIPTHWNTSTETSVVPEEEKEIRKMKYQMIKSIYKKKLELNQSGRLLLPKSIRDSQQLNFNISKNFAPTVDPSNQEEQTENQKRVSTRLGDRMLKKLMKGPNGRLKQRQLLLEAKQSSNIQNSK